MKTIHMIALALCLAAGTMACSQMASAQNDTQTAPPPSDNPPAAAPAAPAASLEEVRDYVLEFMAGLVGTKSPAYRQMSEVQDKAGFNVILPMCRKVIAAVASPHQAAEMEAEVARRMAGG